MVNVRLVAQLAAEPVHLAAASPGESGAGAIADRVPLGGLPVGIAVRGPVMLDGVDATARIEPGWSGTVHESGAIVVERV